MNDFKAVEWLSLAPSCSSVALTFNMLNNRLFVMAVGFAIDLTGLVAIKCCKFGRGS